MEVAHYLLRHLGPVAGKEKLDTFLRAPFQVDDLDGDLLAPALARYCPDCRSRGRGVLSTF